MNKRIGWYAACLLALAMVTRASVIVYNAVLVNETALAYNNTYSVDLQSNGVNALSAQATYSSATIPSATFQDGSQSHGSFTVLNYAALAAAPAVNHITVVTNTDLTGASLVLPGYVFREGLDWHKVATTSGTAESIKLALAQVPFLSVSRAGSVVYATAPAGSFYNSYQLVSSTQTALAVATPYFTGGQDNASVRINGVILRQGINFTAATSNAATATSLASGINASSLLNTVVTAGASGAVVTSTSTSNGAVYNYSLVSSTPTALSRSGALMTGGTTPADTLGSATLSIPSHGLTLGLPVLYSTAGGGLIGGLTNQTTYYAIRVDANSVKLASSQSNALLGTGIVVTSTSTQLSAHTFTLAPLAIAGTPSFKWQVSNDNSNWLDLQVSSVTVSSYTNPPTSTIWSFGYIGTRYLRLNVVAPTAGGLGLNVQLIGTN